MTPHPHTPDSGRAVFRSGRTARRSMLVAAIALVSGAPLVAQALGEDPADVPTTAVDRLVAATTTLPELGVELDAPAVSDAVPPIAPAAGAAPTAEVSDPVRPAASVLPAEGAPAPPADVAAPADVVAPAEVVEPVTVVPVDAVPAPIVPTGPDPSAWAALRDCESGGDYSITNPSGKYRGAYQFDRSTWNSVAGRHDPTLVGVDPAAASPGDQDAMAYALYTERGARPWPHCGRALA